VVKLGAPVPCDRRPVSCNDTITGGEGADELTGNAGANQFNFANGSGGGALATFTDAGTTNFDTGDVFAFTAPIDIITDFTSGTDDVSVQAGGIDLDGLAFATGVDLTAVNFIQGDWSAANNEFTIDTTNGGDTLIFYNAVDADIQNAGNLVANFAVLLGTTGVVTGDFIA
jgi:Ca2+-binding RTX toxin-like protein